MSKARNLEILQYKIAKEDEKIKNMKKFGISQHKIDWLEGKKAMHQKAYDDESKKAD